MLAIHREREHDPADPVGEIAFVLPFHVLQECRQSISNTGRQNRPTVLLALAALHENLVLIEVQLCALTRIIHEPTAATTHLR